jgi:hypothetical protein
VSAASRLGWGKEFTSSEDGSADSRWRVLAAQQKRSKEPSVKNFSWPLDWS